MVHPPCLGLGEAGPGAGALGTEQEPGAISGHWSQGAELLLGQSWRYQPAVRVGSGCWSQGQSQEEENDLRKQVGVPILRRAPKLFPRF